MAEYDLRDSGDTFRPWLVPFQKFPEERIGIVANSDVPGDLEACQRYADAHGLPRVNIVSVAGTDRITIATGLPSNGAIYDRFVAPIRDHANQRNLVAVLAGPTLPGLVLIPSSGNTLRMDELIGSCRMWRSATEFDPLNFNPARSYEGKVNLNLANPSPANPADLRDIYWPPMAAKTGPTPWANVKVMTPEQTARWGRPGGALAVGKIGWWAWQTFIPFDGLAFVDTLNERYLAARSRTREEALALPHIIGISPVSSSLENVMGYLQHWLRANLGMAVKWDVVSGSVAASVAPYLDPAFETPNLNNAAAREPAYFVVGGLANYTVYPPWDDPYIAQRFAAQLGGGLIAWPSFPYLEGGWMVGGGGNLGLCTQTSLFHITTGTVTDYPSIFFGLLRGMSWLEANAYCDNALGTGDPLFRPYPGGLNYATDSWDSSQEIAWPTDWPAVAGAPASASWGVTAGASSAWS